MTQKPKKKVQTKKASAKKASVKKTPAKKVVAKKAVAKKNAPKVKTQSALKETDAMALLNHKHPPADKDVQTFVSAEKFLKTMAEQSNVVIKANNIKSDSLRKRMLAWFKIRK